MPGKELVQSVLRALDILECTAGGSHGIHLAEISDELNLNRTTVYNLLRTLTERGYLKKDPSNSYRLGPQLLELVRRENDSALYRAAGKELLRMVKVLPGSIAGLAELSGERICVRLRVSPDRPEYLQHPMDFTMPIYTTCTGLCFLMQEQYRRAIENSWSFEEFGLIRWKTRENLESFLQESRIKGWVAMDVEREASSGVAEPVWEHFVLNMCCPKEKKKLALALLHESVQRIRKQAGEWQ